MRCGCGETGGSGQSGSGIRVGGAIRRCGVVGVIGAVVVLVCRGCGSQWGGVPSHPQVSVPGVRRAVRVRNGEVGDWGSKKPSARVDTGDDGGQQRRRRREGEHVVVKECKEMHKGLQ